MSTMTTTTTTRDRGDRYGPTEWAQLVTASPNRASAVIGNIPERLPERFSGRVWGRPPIDAVAANLRQ